MWKQPLISPQWLVDALANKHADNGAAHSRDPNYVNQTPWNVSLIGVPACAEGSLLLQ